MSAGAGASSAAMDQSQVYNYPLPTSTQHMLFSNKQTALRELQRAQKMHIDKCALPGSAPFSCPSITLYARTHCGHSQSHTHARG